MDRVLVLGATGMLGSALMRFLPQDYKVYGTVRHKTSKKYQQQVKEIFKYAGTEPIVFDVNDNLDSIFECNPDFIINCIGAIPQRNNSNADLHDINSTFPIILSLKVEMEQRHLIHVSTDCVFSGQKGFYSEDSNPDSLQVSGYISATSKYGQTKALGEIIRSRHVTTIRTSFFGPEPIHKVSIFEWMLNNKEPKISGYINAIFSGLPTSLLSNVISKLMRKYNCGLYNVALHPFSKFRLLSAINEEYSLGKEIIPAKYPIYNKSLNPEKLIFNFPDIGSMLKCSIEEAVHDMRISFLEV